MTSFRIFTESDADIKFLKDFVQFNFDIRLQNESFYELGAWSGYKTNQQPLAAIRTNADEQRATILILDADNDFEQRVSEVREDFQRFGIPVHLFLFPNNSAVGNLEYLLTTVAVERKLINCFLAYEECVSDYNRPMLYKARIYSYLDTLLEPGQKVVKNDLRKEANRNYLNAAHWDLKHQSLNPLREFLSPFFNEDNDGE